MKKQSQVYHGEAKDGGTKEYRAWLGIIERCTRRYSRVYRYYGGRGIRICDRWAKSFRAFVDDVGRAPTPAHQLDRIDNDGHYKPGNVRWATRAENGRNKRNNRNVTHRGRTLCVSAWAEETGIPEATIRRRLRAGWTVARALTPGDQRRKLTRR